MSPCVALLVLLGPVAAADEPKPAEDKGLSAEAKAEVKKLAGKWKLVKVAGGGKESEPPAEAHFVFNGTEVTITSGGKTETLRIATIDTTTDPKCLDLVEKRQGRPDRTLEGVYRLDGDTLLVAHSLPGGGKNRPTGFEKSVERAVVWTLKRVKE